MTHFHQNISPLVRSIAKKENASDDELLLINGTGEKVELQNDILSFISSRNENKNKPYEINQPKKVNEVGLENEIISDMTRIQKITSEHMVDSYKKSVHVQSFEADVTELWNCTLKIKMNF